MNVMIADDSVEICERLTAMLRELSGVEIAGQAATVVKPV
jgi:hypothetical protein